MRRSFLFLVLVAGVFCAGCKEKDASKSSTEGGNPVTAPVDYLGAVSKGKTTAEKTLDTAVLNQSIQLFQTQEGRYPRSLKELVSPDYLPALPKPPHGMKFDYNPQTGQVRVVPQ